MMIKVTGSGPLTNGSGWPTYGSYGSGTLILIISVEGKKQIQVVFAVPMK
jgi:hypothetical protein